MTQDQALLILKTGVNVFLTGEPGSGKTHTVNEYVAYLRARGVEPAITASTGIAATHIGGMTIHSWSGLGIKTNISKYDLDRIASSEYIAKRVLRARVLIIDEVSMLTSEMFSTVDAVCREIRQSQEPFGGIQVVVVGDFFQLPPITKIETERNAQTAFIEESPGGHFAYDSSVWPRLNPVVCYLTDQYRQDDRDLLSILSAIRGNVFDNNHLHHIEARRIEYHSAPDDVPKLFSHNIDVDRVNGETLAKLPGDLNEFAMTSEGTDALIAALKKGCLSPEMLHLKIGAAVMFTKNNQKEGFVNGTLGIVLGFDKLSGYPIVKTRSGRRITVSPMDWAVEENGHVRARVKQLPLRLAWAFTVHKSQGMSLDEAIMDLTQVFEFGQGYVALSRLRRLSGLYILGWNERTFQVHPEVLAKDASFRDSSGEAEVTFGSISSSELMKMYENFILACGGKNKPIKDSTKDFLAHEEKKVDTYSKTLALWNEGKTISQIAETRQMTDGTILSHIEKLASKEKINRMDISRLLTSSLRRALPAIQAAFSELDTDKLSPVFERLDGTYSYDELRIVRMTLKNIKTTDNSF